MSSGKLTNLIQPLVEELDYEFVGLEQSSNPKNPVVVIYIDTPDGIAVEDCEKVSREVAALLDVEDPISSEYTLEVSSPGADRRLFSLEQCRQFTGEEVNIRLRTSVDGRRKVKGKLVNVVDDAICIDEEGNSYQFPFDVIEKINIVF